ncbi:hypothetical protein Asp14428_63250 [Actinoplanes sp. NBRC 14428]|nr:hypothetical protein Asp14428_63250 [Actinoplanes sp. NBRC 14428]
MRRGSESADPDRVGSAGGRAVGRALRRAGAGLVRYVGLGSGGYEGRDAR